MENKLKEHIKSLVKNILKEDGINVTDNSGSQTSTPIAFNKQKNIAEDDKKKKKGMGRRFIPEETVFPGSLRGKDFKVIRNSSGWAMMISPMAKTALGFIQRGRTNFENDSKLPELTRTIKEKISQTTRGVIKRGVDHSRIDATSGLIPVNATILRVDDRTGDVYFKFQEEDKDKSPITQKIYEHIDKEVEKELLKEGSYSQFKNEVKFRTKSEQLHKAIREVKKKLQDIDRLVEYTSRMKQELSEGEDGVKYWKATSKNVSQIAETITQLSNKIKNLNQ